MTTFFDKEFEMTMSRPVALATATGRSDAGCSTPRRRQFLRNLLVSAAAGAALFGAVGQASAYVGEVRAIPSLNGASGSATLTSFSSGHAKATVRLWRGTNSRCVYAQAAPYAWLAVDGGWKEVPGSRTCGSSTSYYSDSFFLSYNGLKFRICQNNPWAADACGSSMRISG